MAPTFFTLIISGAMVIVLNYMGIFGGTAQNWILFSGLGLMGASFVVATRLY